MKIFQSVNSYSFVVEYQSVTTTARKGATSIIPRGTFRTLQLLELMCKVAEVK